MNSIDIMAEAIGRIKGSVHSAVGDLDLDQLTTKPYAEGNTIAWLVWHLTRVQDHHLADAAGAEQLWITGGWRERFNLPFDEHATGYGHGPDEVTEVRAEASLLLGYYDAVSTKTLEWVAGLSESDFDRVIDESWDPPVTLGMRLVSVISDDLQHAGQATYLRGLLLAR